jgi:hypothetical protein
VHLLSDARRPGPQEGPRGTVLKSIQSLFRAHKPSGSGVRYELQFPQNTTAFVGYRPLDFDREGSGDDEIVNTLSVGLRFAF